MDVTPGKGNTTQVISSVQLRLLTYLLAEADSRGKHCTGAWKESKW